MKENKTLMQYFEWYLRPENKWRGGVRDKSIDLFDILVRALFSCC